MYLEHTIHCICCSRLNAGNGHLLHLLHRLPRGFARETKITVRYTLVSCDKLEIFLSLNCPVYYIRKLPWIMRNAQKRITQSLTSMQPYAVHSCTSGQSPAQILAIGESSSDGHRQSSRGRRKYMHTLCSIVLNTVLYLNCDSHSGNGCHYSARY